MQRREHQMPGFRSLQRHFHRLAIAHLAQQNYLGRLPQRSPQSQRKIRRVRVQLPLMNGRVFVLVQKLDRVFDRDDVIKLCLINQIDHCRQRRALATAGRAGNQDNPVFQFSYFPQLLRQVEVFEGRRTRWNHAHHDRVGAALLKNVHAKAIKARQAERDIRRAIFFQALGRHFLLADD